MANTLEQLTSLVKALEAGSYNAAPSTLTQGASLQVEDLSPVMNNVTFDDSHIKLQKMLKVTPCKSTLAQFDRQLSYGIFGGSAQLEGAIGQEETSDFVRVVVPMAYYSHVRKVTLVANLVETVDGKKAEERAASDAAKKLAADIEFDLFRGKEAFSNGGVFDGNPLVIPALPNILGLDTQIRQSDGQRIASDLMFSEYGSDDSVVIPGGGTLAQTMIEDAAVRSAMNLGNADKLVVDPKVLSSYNKLIFANQRMVWGGSSPVDATGADLRRQWVSGGTVNIEASRFLSGKTKAAPARSTGPAFPTTVTGAAGAGSTGLAAGVYTYAVTSCNEMGESVQTVSAGVTITAGQQVTLTITHPGSGIVRFFNVYRSAVGAAAVSAAACKFIGRVAINTAAGATTTSFLDLGNKLPGFVTGFLLEGDTMEMRELAPYSRLKLAVVDLSQPEAHFRFLTLAVTQPRKNVLLDNLLG